jgi:PAS domain-containing protein
MAVPNKRVGMSRMTPISQVWSPQSLDMVPRAVAQRLVDALYSQAATLVIGIAAMVMAGALAFVRTGVTWLLVWTGLSAVVGAARLLQHWSYHQRRTMGSSRLWARRFLIGSWVVGALWGGAAATAVVTMPDPFVLFLLLVVGTGYIVGGAVRSNAVPIVVVGQSALTLVPLLVACLATADLYMRCFAVFVALEFSGIVMITRFLSAMTMRMLIADEEKCQQLAQLTEAQFELRRLAGEQEARERALHRSEQLFRATFEQAAVGMSQIGLDGTWLRVNDKLCEITGYSRDELLARRSQDITHPEDYGIEVAHVRALLGGETEVAGGIRTGR